MLNCRQDWEPVVFKKPTPKKQPIYSSPKPLGEEEKGNVDKLRIISSELAKTIIEGRLNKKMTQVQLAKQCNMQLHTIQQIESGKANYVPNEIQIIARILGINTSSIKKTK